MDAVAEDLVEDSEVDSADEFDTEAFLEGFDMESLLEEPGSEESDEDSDDAVPLEVLLARLEDSESDVRSLAL